MLFAFPFFMKLKTLLLPLLLLFFAGCGKIKDPEFRRVDNFRLINIGLQEAVVGFNVTYFNPNNFGVSVKEGQADIYVDAVYLGKFLQDTSILVMKNGEFSIHLSGTVSLQTVLRMNLRELSQRPVLLKANGNVKVGKAGVFISKPFSYQGQHTLEDFALPR